MTDPRLMISVSGIRGRVGFGLTPDGATFRQEVEEFAQISQVTDLDVDRSYLVAT
ncbi:MAG: hypothetical protein HC936_13330 [Leptolyngbyaceae cyanobacterium SU_3_3]|nr:hypothetical protein [Leptolyngbyaceae cyanobacterium SU_3_3]